MNNRKDQTSITSEYLHQIKEKQKKKKVSVIICSALAAIVATTTIAEMIQPAAAVAVKENMLDCHFDVHEHTDECYEPVYDEEGNEIGRELICGQADYVVHQHTAECYKTIYHEDEQYEETVLVCTLPETEKHEHDESCYEERQVLVCEEDHEHDESCYETEKVLTCDKLELHTHTDECYEIIYDEAGNPVDKKLICGKIELLEHQHDESCFTEVEVAVDDEEAETAAEEETVSADMLAQNFHGETAELTVDVTAPEGAFPKDTTMSVHLVEDEDVLNAAAGAAEDTATQVTKVQAVDITFKDAEGKEIQPLQPIQVIMTPIDRKPKENETASVYHVDDKKEATSVELTEEADTAAEAVAFDADAFSVYALVYTIELETKFITAEGETYKITVTYNSDAGIPEDAELKVREIQSSEEDYDYYYNNAANTAKNDAGNQGIETPIINNMHIFDIEISHNSEKIEPSAPVTVSIQLLDTESEYLSVVHFAEEGIETKNASKKDNAINNNVSEISFETESFSVYTVVNVTDFANIANAGPYVLVTGIANDPGAETGYHETWGTDYFTIIVNAHAVSNTTNNNGISSTGVHLWTENGTSYAGGEVPEWTFESAGNGNYYLSVTDKNGIKQYLTRNGPFEWGTSLGALTNNNKQYSQYKVSSNGDGTVLIYYDGGGYDQKYYLYNDGNGEWSTRTYKFRNTGFDLNSAAYRFKLCRKSDDFDSFAAQKVSVSTITTNTNYVIYRKFVDVHGNESLYALAHDGSFVRVYDGGDTIYWRETDKNIYWNYQVDDSSPILFTKNPDTNETIYINPNYTASQTLSSTSNGLTLIGKDNEEYGTTIECWDQTAYDYAGLHVTLDNNNNATLSSGTRVAGTSDEFLFAVASSMPGSTAETVDTVDSDSLGIKITMFDYGEKDGNYNAGDKLPGMTNVIGNGSDAYTPHAAHSLVRKYLSNGLPVSSINGQEMSGLFTDNGSEVTYSKDNVNHLFIQSYYDENGTFRYRSEDNYAYLGFDQTDFTVYRQAATPYTSNISVGHTYYHHGHYMPFNDIDMNNNLSRLMNQYGNAYEDGEAVGSIPVEDGRSYGNLYGVQGKPNYYTGMKMEANFTQPRDGKLENGDDMVFKFTGDDDMWVYIDDVLILDIGGIHEPLSGTINFSTGVVSNPAGSSLAGKKTLYDIFMAALNDQSTPQTVKDKIREIKWKDVNGDGKPDTFADFTNHSFSSFYMERGAGASNLDIQFNLKVIHPDEFTVEKELPENVDNRFVNQIFKYHATYRDHDNVKPLFAGAVNSDGKTVCTKVVYRDKQTVDEEGRPVEVEVPVDQDGYFYLKAGEAAVFKMANGEIEYDVKEVEIDSNLINKVEINGEEVSITSGEADAGFDYVQERSLVLFVNHPFTQNLEITKHITEDSIPLTIDENPVFEFRVYLESTVTVTGEDGEPTPVQQLVPYSYGPYYLVKYIDNVRHYFTLTGANNAPVDQGTNPVVCSTTGRSGTINSIPPEYTIIIPNLAVGTNFYLEERRDNMPSGFEFVREELAEGTYDSSSLIQQGDPESIINRVLPRDETDHQEFDPDTVGRIKNGVDAQSHVYNRKPGSKLTIIKTEKGNNNKKLVGAVFTLKNIQETITANGITYITGSDAVEKTATTNEDGIAEFDVLAPGYYEIEETVLPTGYIKVGTGKFYVHISEETVKLIEIDSTETPPQWKEVDTSGSVIKFISAAASGTATVENEPGAELPYTGGPGTHLYMIFGSILLLSAGILLIQKHRTTTE